MTETELKAKYAQTIWDFNTLEITVNYCISNLISPEKKSSSLNPSEITQVVVNDLDFREKIRLLSGLTSVRYGEKAGLEFNNKLANILIECGQTRNDLVHSLCHVISDTYRNYILFKINPKVVIDRILKKRKGSVYSTKDSIGSFSEEQLNEYSNKFIECTNNVELFFSMCESGFHF